MCRLQRDQGRVSTGNETIIFTNYPLGCFPLGPFPPGRIFPPSLLPPQGQGSASLIVFSLNGHIAINKWLNFASQGNGKIPPGQAAWGHMDIILHVGLSSTLKTGEEIQVHHSQMLQEDQTSQIAGLGLPQGTCSCCSVLQSVLFCAGCWRQTTEHLALIFSLRILGSIPSKTYILVDVFLYPPSTLLF